jgi:hypothetical protein
MARHRHLILRNLGKASESFEPYGGGSTRRPSRVDDRAEHAAALREQFGDLAADIRASRTEQAGVGVPSARRGVTVSIASREGTELVLGTSRRANSRGMQLLNVRRGADVAAGRGRDRAAVYLTSNALKSLNKALDRYEAWQDDDGDDDDAVVDFDEVDGQVVAGTASKRPQLFWLFESAGSFRQGDVENLWTDTLESFPIGGGAVEWEIWVREPMAAIFETAVTQLGVRLTGRPTTFVDIRVYNGVADKATLSRLIASSAAVVELRAASNFIADHADLPPSGRLAEMERIAARVVPAPPTAPYVTLLDTGADPSNPLLAPALPPTRCRAVSSAWDRFDADGHGSKMAGVALYGDLADIAPGTGPIRLENALESIAVFDPASPVRIPARDAIARGVSDAEEAETHPRVYCLSATAVGEPEDGRPTATSGTLDTLAFGDRVRTRLFCVAVGNVDATAAEPYQVSSYRTLNEAHGIQPPAQALNVLSVGAATMKCSGPSPLADEGNLSPRSRTSQAWDGRPHKPDILMEGGNHGIDPGGLTSRPHGPDMIATTSNTAGRIGLTGDTSAACAAAARLAARVMARYPAMRPETVRGLLAHCAEWTPAMRARRTAMIAAGASELDATLAALDCFGWGVPDEERVFWSAGNAATLVAEDTLRPYKRDTGKGVTLKEMKAFRLPWPDAALRALAARTVELRCTLSYFVQPDLHSAGLERRQLYPSHGLKFDLQRHGEGESRALRRFNKAVAIDVNDPSGGEDDGWLLGWGKRVRGTLHHDVWSGPAYQLVGRRLLSVTPMRGWWAASPLVAPAEVPIPFSLIVSIRTPETRNDLVTEMRANVPVGVLVDAPSVVTV